MSEVRGKSRVFWTKIVVPRHLGQARRKMLLSEQTMGLVSAILRRPSEGDFFACCSLSGVANISIDEDDNAVMSILPTRRRGNHFQLQIVENTTTYRTHLILRILPADWAVIRSLDETLTTLPVLIDSPSHTRVCVCVCVLFRRGRGRGRVEWAEGRLDRMTYGGNVEITTREVP